MDDIASTIDISTTQNTLSTSNECPIQFASESFSFEEMIKPKFDFSINLIPDEKIMPCGIIQTGFTNSNIPNGEDLKEGLSIIYDNLEYMNENQIIIGYNLQYDLGILNKSFKRILNKDPIDYDTDKLIDVMELAKLVIPVQDICSYSADCVLIYLTNNLDILNKIKIKGRGSKIDNAICRLILNLICKRKQWYSFDDVLNFLKSPQMIETFPFGKHRGEKISDIIENDNNYIQWVMNTPEILMKNPNLKYTLEKMTKNKPG